MLESRSNCTILIKVLSGITTDACRGKNTQKKLSSTFFMNFLTELPNVRVEGVFFCVSAAASDSVSLPSELSHIMC